MLPVNIGGHSAYQDTFVSEFLKFYPDPFSLPKSTWYYIVQFWYLELSMTDSIMQDCYSIFGPEPRLPVILPVLHPDFFLCWNAGSLNQKIHSFSSSGFITSSSCPFPARRDLLPPNIWLLPVTVPLSAPPPSSEKNGSAIVRKMAALPVIANVIIPSRIATGDGTPFIDLNPGHTRHFTYKDDFTIDEDGVPICKMGLRLHKDGKGNMTEGLPWNAPTSVKKRTIN